MRLLLLVLTCFSTLLSAAQSFEHEWFLHETQSPLTNPSDKTAIVRTTSENGVVFVTLESPVFDDGIGKYGGITLQKISSNNSEEWSLELTASVKVENVEIGNDGRVFIAGSYYDDIHFSSGEVLAYQPTGFALSNMFLICLEPTGEIAWAKNLSIGLDGMADYIHTGLAIGNEGEVHYAYTTYQEAYFVSLDSNGDAINSFSASGIQLIGGLKCDSENNLYVSGGCFQGDLIFPSFEGNAPYDYNAFIIKINSDQNGGWMRFYEDITNQFVSLALNTEEQPVIVYSLFLDIMVGDIPLTVSNFGDDFGLIQLDENGTPLWATSLNDAATNGGLSITARNAVRADQSGNIWLGGQVQGTLSFSGDYVLEAGPFQNFENALVRFDNQGLVTTAALLSGGGYDKLYSFDPISAVGLYYSGYFTEEYSPYPFMMPEEPTNYRVIGKLLESPVSSIPTHVLSSSPKVFPNPAHERLSIQCGEELLGERYSIVDVLGREVRQGIVLSTTTMIPLQDLSAGKYVMLIKNHHLLIMKE